LSGAEFVSRQGSSSLQPFSFDPIAPHVPNMLFHVPPSRQPPAYASLPAACRAFEAQHVHIAEQVYVAEAIMKASAPTDDAAGAPMLKVLELALKDHLRAM